LNLSVPERHMLKIARMTLKADPRMIAVMGGMTLEQACDTIARLTGKN
jgi:hypothetical protein